MLPPLPRCSSWVYSSLISPHRVSLLRKGRRVGLHIDLFEACSAFTRVAACTLARSPIRDPLIEGFSHFVTSMTAPIASGWSESPGGPCTHWKAPPCHGAPPLRPLRIASPRVSAGWSSVLGSHTSQWRGSADAVIGRSRAGGSDRPAQRALLIHAQQRPCTRLVWPRRIETGQLVPSAAA